LFFEDIRYLPRKKGYAKIAITLTDSKGRALRVLKKKSPHLRFAAGSIFFPKTLTAAATWLLKSHILFFFFFFLFSSFWGKIIVVFYFSKSKLAQSKA